MKRAWLVGAGFVVVTLTLPFVLDDTRLSIYVLMGLAVLAVTGISLLMGYAGQVSLGQAAFYAVGAYTAAIPAVHGWPPLVGLVAAPLVAAAAAALLGAVLLRLRGHYLAFATLALQLIILSVAAEIEFFGGAIGLQGIPQFGVGSVTLDDAQEYALLTWAAVAVVLLLTANIVASRPGRALRALARSEQAAAASGIPVTRYKVTVFALSAAFAGLAGGIYAFFLGYIAPGSFTIAMSVEWVVMAVFGGLGTRWGPVVGTVAVTLVVQVLNDLSTRPGAPSYAPTVLGYAAYAVLLIGVLLFMPAGVVPWLRGRWDRLRRSRGDGGSAPSQAPDWPEPATVTGR
ncbi:branched-chain amino acid ABC transporter permease [Cryptosporangium aurantiacum]|uniref:Amino acid/amide ABC transporter membrane protein 2, HAAT family n=1 Tax=Cryptosporangium aurantiacum TaxID=134849 RepID=A0A1M7R6Z6_9ACTN|nr:branched-chain amino acid ABC transporter permease [Cryptosporangium aurantiacum]SHN41899.1 amino acid/amide ABC transporter membrane protein 2, HAAT family [Cryptosporangium aurantiacum]